MTVDGEILLGTVAFEPNRWAMVDPEWGPTVRVSDWLGQIRDAGFDGLEVWEKHLSQASDTEALRVIQNGADPAQSRDQREARSPAQSRDQSSDRSEDQGGDVPSTGPHGAYRRVPIRVLNSYVSFDQPGPDGRRAVADWVERTGATGVKFNVGNDRKQEIAYGERIAEWLEMMPEATALLCECHHGISIAEEPDRAARIFEASGTVDQVQAIVHTHESPDHIRARFDAYGDRISHIHVNYLDFETGTGSPRLRDHRRQLEADVELLQSLSFAGSWTIEFTNGVLHEDNDHPEFLLASAADDLAVLRDVLA